ncbi:MAG: hypothetical protein EZS28_021356 [Streblomastix strix]|uniref:Uncharacterized protein n=1 Tax=Streblomastix strix TaxID=222440 RepID=A0A5J4VKT3_9EUKA|nr:MAG: hypothetical protein EZS28_021356 [Streblomastix strix]
MKPGFIISEVMAWFAVQQRNPKTSCSKQSCIKTMPQLIFDREPMYCTPSALTYRAISNSNVQNKKILSCVRYRFTIQSLGYVTSRLDVNKLGSANEVIIFTFINNQCFRTIRSEKNWNAEPLTQRNSLHMVVTIKRAFSSRDINSCTLFRIEQCKSMSIAKISELHTIPIKKIEIEGFTAFSIKHASIPNPAEMRIQEKDLNIFTNHAPDSKSARAYYVFAANNPVNGIVARVVTIGHGLENQYSTSTSVSQKKRKDEALIGDIHTLSPSGGDSMLSPFRTTFLPLYHPVFLPNSLSDLKVQTSNANTTTNSFQTTPIVELDEFKYKPVDDRVRAARQQIHVKASNTNNLSTSLHDSSHGSPQRKQELTPTQSQMIKDLSYPDAKNQRK